MALTRKFLGGVGVYRQIAFPLAAAVVYLDGGAFEFADSRPRESGSASREWHFVKQRLAFCRLAQDGDCEGTMFLTQLPTAAEATLIREALSLRKTANISPECRARKILDGKALRARQNGKLTSTHKDSI
jgi:hypothetical protein